MKIEIYPDGAMLAEVLISPAVTEPAGEEGGFMRSESAPVDRE